MYRYQVVRYHTAEWALLVEMGWTTMEVIYGQGSTRWARMIQTSQR